MRGQSESQASWDIFCWLTASKQPSDSILMIITSSSPRQVSCFGRSLQSMSYLGLVQAYLLHRDCLEPSIRAVLTRMSVDGWIWMTIVFDMFNIKSPKLMLKYYESSARRHVLWSVRNWKPFLLENCTNFNNQFEYFKLYPYVVDAARNFNRTGWIGSRYSSPLHKGTSIEIDQGRLIIRWRGK